MHSPAIPWLSGRTTPGAEAAGDPAERAHRRKLDGVRRDVLCHHSPRSARSATGARSAAGTIGFAARAHHLAGGCIGCFDRPAPRIRRRRRRRLASFARRKSIASVTRACLPGPRPLSRPYDDYLTQPGGPDGDGDGDGRRAGARERARGTGPGAPRVHARAHHPYAVMPCSVCRWK